MYKVPHNRAERADRRIRWIDRGGWCGSVLIFIGISLWGSYSTAGVRTTLIIIGISLPLIAAVITRILARRSAGAEQPPREEEQ